MPWELWILFRQKLILKIFDKRYVPHTCSLHKHWFCMFSFCTNLRMIAQHCWIKLWTCFNPQFLIQHEHTVAQLHPDPEAWGQSRVKRRRQKREDEARERVSEWRAVGCSENPGGHVVSGIFCPPNWDKIKLYDRIWGCHGTPRHPRLLSGLLSSFLRSAEQT